MYLGHFNHSKGVDILIEAMPSILSSLPETNLFLIWNHCCLAKGQKKGSKHLTCW
jgi:hypothetical protein